MVKVKKDHDNEDLSKVQYGKPQSGKFLSPLSVWISRSNEEWDIDISSNPLFQSDGK